jgi:hypothetical protein
MIKYRNKISYLRECLNSQVKNETDCFNNGDEKLVKDQLKNTALADSGSQVIMLWSKKL